MSTQPPANNQQESSGPPLRALAMVLLSLAVVFLGLGVFSLTGSDEDAATTNAAVVATTTSAAAAAPQASTGAAATTTTAAPTTSAAAASGSIRVLNNSNVSGLAAGTAQTLETAGFTVGETGNYSSGTIATSTVYYDPAVTGEQAEAERIGTILGYAVEPRFEGIQSSPPGIIVMVTQ